MAAPDNRVPVRLARGTKATLDANIADLYEGEICYATDENICYVKEGSALEPASGGASNLGGLTDVDLSTPATDGQVLIWSAVDSAFLPGDAANPVVSINDLSDVDISTVAPAEGQALIWNETDSEFQPGDVSTAVAFADLTDYEAPVSYTVYDGISGFTGTTGGIYYAYGSSRLAMNVDDEAGLTLDDTNIAQVGALIELSTDGGVTWGNGVSVTSQHALPSAGFGFWRFDHDGPADWPANIVGVFETGTDLRLRWAGGSGGLGDGDILAYNTTNSTWQPVPNTAPTVEGLSNTDFGSYSGNTTYVNDATPDDNAGEWYMANGTDYIAYNNAQSGPGKMGDLQVGDSVTITYSDDSTETLEIQAAEADNSAGSKFIRFTTGATAVVASGGISLSAPGRFGAAPGEVLTWNGTAWVSTTPAAAVDELDDISNVDAKVSAGTLLGRYAAFTSDPPAANGEWRAESYNELRIFFTDSDGVDIETAFDALPTSGSVWIVPDGDFGNVIEVTYAGTTNQTTYGRFTGTNIDDAINTYSEIAVYSTLPSQNNPADGQILSYSTSQSKWVVSSIPEPPAGVEEMADLSDVNIGASVFTVIGSGRFDTALGAFPTGNPGEYYDQPGQNRIFISDTDADSVDMNQFFQGTDQVGNRLQIATDSGFTNLLVDATITAYSDQSSNSRYYFTWGFDLGFSLTGEIYVRVGTLDSPVGDGQALIYSSSSGNWEHTDILTTLDNSTIGQLSNVKDDTPTPVVTTWTHIDSSAAASVMPSASGYVGIGGTALHPSSANGDEKANLRAFVATLSLPQELTFRVSDGDLVINISNVADTMDDPDGPYQPRILFQHASSITAPTATGTIEILEYSAFLGELAAAPADGQVLTWVDSNSQYEPVSPAARNLVDFEGVTLEDGAGLIYDSVNQIFKQNQTAPDTLSAMAYKFKNTLSGDPSTGRIALDNADPTLATEIRVHKTTTNGVDLTNVFAAGVGTAQGIYIQRKDDASEAHFFRTTGPATDSGAYMTVGVEHVSGTGTFTNNKVMVVGVYAKAETASLAPLSVPASATDTGAVGDVRYDADYVYICVAANTWKRAALTTW